MSEQRYLTVTALTKYIKRKFDVDPHMKDVWLKGEISNFKQHSRGHMYFTLKDQNARLQVVMFSGQNKNLAFKPQEGMKVLVRGEVTVYEASGSYQMYIKEMQPDGVGSLFLAYEELKKKLAGEGLFSPEVKKPLPKYPHAVGVITSPTGAAVRDIITTLKRRYPLTKIIVIPALVQGTNAAPSIVKAIQKAHELPGIDVLIVGRGGGSIEELWAFNEEVVAREIFAAKLPIISAVGHETDFTIADFVADMRAPTPTAAAELAVPNIHELMERLTDRTFRLHRSSNKLMRHYKDRLMTLQKSYAFRFPKNLYAQKQQDLDRLLDNLDAAMKRMVEKKQGKLEQLAGFLLRNHPKKQWELEKANLEQRTKLLTQLMQQALKQKQWEFQNKLAKIDALSPLKIMNRGYSLVYQEDGTIIKQVKQAKKGDTIQVHLQDGQLDCEIQAVKERT
ncbi:exodeoxyribonuclease VII large subunit [Sutcliffiella rhizosphaerae]|uniref:Exodeoxyribonuclease 7 large subunit n=1 Tax=Sutcliffiella rhizosphaerae TaxID=2880967 RepID=A0ABN8AD95_9BACI|nr:exodeoxyribonuclease VII large subunit [Sutcliffiella rhizosphaerae]CAG9623180.1 Exodeoxyribonuclease 7 large subunit [Sutcliffiella rhizosphaerae]